MIRQRSAQRWFYQVAEALQLGRSLLPNCVALTIQIPDKPGNELSVRRAARFQVLLDELNRLLRRLAQAQDELIGPGGVFAGQVCPTRGPFAGSEPIARWPLHRTPASQAPDHGGGIVIARNKLPAVAGEGERPHSPFLPDEAM